MSDDVLLWILTILIALLVVNISYWLGRSHQTWLCTEAHLEIVRQMSQEADEMEESIQRLEEALKDMESRRS